MGPASRSLNLAACLAVILTALAARGGAQPAATTGPTTRPDFSARIHFQPADETEPHGVATDAGDAYGDRSSGHAYGWDNGSWELAAPNGHYAVELTAHEPAKVKDLGDIKVEGVSLLDSTIAMNRLASSRTVVVDVKDRRLTLSSARTVVRQLRSVEVTAIYDPARIIAWMNIGGSDTNVANRRVGWNIRTAGWQEFVNKIIRPQIAWGARRVMIHNPFGTLPGEPMQFDQYLHAKDAGLNWLTDGFVEAWKPITDSGIEVICYLGSIRLDPDFDNAGDDAWKARFWASAAPALQAGMSIGLDSASTEPADSKVYQAALLLEGRGVKVYIEPRPGKEMTHWHRFPIITESNFWLRSDPERHPDSAWAARNGQLGSEVIRIVTQPPKGETWHSRGWIADYTRHILRDGHTAATWVRMMQQEKVELNTLIKLTD